MITAAILAVAVVVNALCLAVGFTLGLIAYHQVRLGVTRWMPVYKAHDQSKDRTKQVALAQKLQQEAADLQTAYLSGLKMDQDNYIAGVRK